MLITNTLDLTTKQLFARYAERIRSRTNSTRTSKVPPQRALLRPAAERRPRHHPHRHRREPLPPPRPPTPPLRERHPRQTLAALPRRHRHRPHHRHHDHRRPQHPHLPPRPHRSRTRRPHHPDPMLNGRDSASASHPAETSGQPLTENRVRHENDRARSALSRELACDGRDPSMNVPLWPLVRLRQAWRRSNRVEGEHECGRGDGNGAVV